MHPGDVRDRFRVAKVHQMLSELALHSQGLMVESDRELAICRERLDPFVKDHPGDRELTGLIGAAYWWLGDRREFAGSFDVARDLLHRAEAVGNPEFYVPRSSLLGYLEATFGDPEDLPEDLPPLGRLVSRQGHPLLPGRPGQAACLAAGFRGRPRGDDPHGRARGRHRGRRLRRLDDVVPRGGVFPGRSPRRCPEDAGRFRRRSSSDRSESEHPGNDRAPSRPPGEGSLTPRGGPG